MMSHKNPVGTALLGRLLTGYQSRLVLFLFASIVASVIDVSTPVPVPGHHDVVEVTLLEEVWNSDHRARRDADSNLPDRLTFAVPVASDTAVLMMTRSRLLPVVMSDESSTRAANSFFEGAAVYTELNSWSSMIVKRESGNYMLRGCFVHGNVAWTLRHETRYRRDASNVTGISHRVSRLMSPEKTSFVGDFIEPPGAETHHNDIGDDAPQPERNDTDSDPSSGEPTQHVVEVAFVVDYADYTKWVKYVGVEATPREMRLWYTYIAESVNVRYQNIKDPDITIRTTVTVLRILNSPDDEGLFSNHTHIDDLITQDEGLDNFFEWYLQQEDIPGSDHYMLFTGLNLTCTDLGDIYGVAFESTLCSNESISISENDFNENVGHTAAHELAHSLSALHDEDFPGAVDCAAEYIMSTSGSIRVDPANEGNNWVFSPCSISSFKSFLKSVTCTRENALENTALPAPIAGERAGEVLSRDDQCKLAFQNRNSYFCEEAQKHSESSGLKNLCRGMLCLSPSYYGLCQYVPPQEYTPCADDKWCVSGKCTVKDEQNKTTSTTSHTASTAATTVAQPTSTPTAAAATTTTQPPKQNSSQTVNNITIATSNSMTTLSTTSTLPSRLSTLASSQTAIVSVTFGLCLLLLTVL